MTLQISFDLLYFVYALIFFAIALKIRQSYLKGSYWQQPELYCVSPEILHLLDPLFFKR